ncbi:GNAT family N-acetyltransferase [Nocardioides panacisoli]|uniref:GNAT family N-acetyltransferase n=1 Tax=Nocardioides panacisoli TaxID=627624 RepID=A0ABP7IEW8_9ACTN
MTVTTAMTTRPVDVHDDADVAAWHAAMVTVEAHELGEHAVTWTLPELLVALREPRKDRRWVPYVGEVDGEVVGYGDVGLPLLDNLTSAEVGVGVLPEHRRHGYGSQLLRHVEQVAAEHGRTRLDAMASWPYDGPGDGAGTPGVEFGRVHGYALGLCDVQREMALPVDEELLERLAAEAAPRHPAYELRTWTGAVPEDLVRGYVELDASLTNEAPTGDNEYEDPSTDLEAFRTREAILAKQQRTKFSCVALDGEGTVVAYTDLVLVGHDPRWVMQWGTLVHREHRGHRLGLAVKAANLLAMQRSGVDLADRCVVTWNAEVNDHMIGINEQLGFVKSARCGELQKKP